MSKLGVSSKFSSAKWDYWQTVLSRSDENIAPLLVEVYKAGAKTGAYKSAVKNLNIDITKSTEGFDFDENLPWDCIESNPSKLLLKNEYIRLSKYS